jgi:Flp pilus assembly protein TadG
MPELFHRLEQLTEREATMKKLTRKTERGQSLVELAISLVVILFLLSGVVEFGIAFFQFITLRDAAQEGALFGSIKPGNAAAIEARVRATAPQGKVPDLTNNTVGDPRRVTVTVTAIDQTTGNTKALSSACVGDGIRVDVAFRHQVFMPFVSPIFRAMSGDGTNTIPLTGSVTDTILQSDAAGCP